MLVVVAVAVLMAVSEGIGVIDAVTVILDCISTSAVCVNLKPPKLITAVRAITVFVGGTPADVGIACGPCTACTGCGR